VTVSSILIVNMNYLGDALMTTPAVRALKSQYSGARIDVIAGSTAAYGALEILALDPDIDKLIPRINGGSLARGWQLFNVIKRGSYDTVVVLPSIPFYNFIAKLFPRCNVLTVPRAREDVHMADHMLNSILNLTPKSPVDRTMVMEVPTSAESDAEVLICTLDRELPLVAFNLGASRPQKRWPAEHFARAAEMLVRAGRAVVLIGGDNEQDIQAARMVMSYVTEYQPGSTFRIVDLVGKTSLRTLSGIISKSRVIVTGDTGAMHIATALRVPVIALFGSTSPEFTGPYGGTNNVIIDLKLSCAPCGTHPTCGGKFDCMVGIKPETVIDTINNILVSEGQVVACKVS
jgi:heptosyltransferase II